VPLHDAVGDVSFPLQTNQNRLNRIIREEFSDPALTLHSLRHTFKDLARDAEINKEVSDFITGHSQGDVAGGYGQGPSLKKRYQAITSIQHPWLG
jgi:integrase